MKAALILLSLIVSASAHANIASASRAAGKANAATNRIVECTPSFGDFDGDSVEIKMVNIKGTIANLGSAEFKTDLDGKVMREFFIETRTDDDTIIIRTASGDVKIGTRGVNDTIMTVESDDGTFQLFCSVK